MAGWQSTKPKTNNQVRMEEEVDVFKFPNKKWVRIRFIGPITSVGYVWFDIISSKKKQKIGIPKICLDYDPETQDFNNKGCPFRSSGAGRFSQKFISNFIVRSVQEGRKFKSGSAKKVKTSVGTFYFKEKGSQTKTPVMAQSFPATFAEKLKERGDLNTVKIDGKKVTKDLSDAKYGRDVLIKFDPDAKGSGMWDVQVQERTPLTEEELKYALQPILDLDSTKPLPKAEAIEEMKKIEKVLANKPKRKDIDKDDDDDDDSDDDDDDNDLDDDDDDNKKSKKK